MSKTSYIYSCPRQYKNTFQRKVGSQWSVICWESTNSIFEMIRSTPLTKKAENLQTLCKKWGCSGDIQMHVSHLENSLAFVAKGTIIGWAHWENPFVPCNVVTQDLYLCPWGYSFLFFGGRGALEYLFHAASCSKISFENGLFLHVGNCCSLFTVCWTELFWCSIHWVELVKLSGCPGRTQLQCSPCLSWCESVLMLSLLSQNDAVPVHTVKLMQFRFSVHSKVWCFGVPHWHTLWNIHCGFKQSVSIDNSIKSTNTYFSYFTGISYGSPTQDWKGVAPLASRATGNSCWWLLQDLDSTFCSVASPGCGQKCATTGQNTNNFHWLSKSSPEERDVLGGSALNFSRKPDHCQYWIHSNSGFLSTNLNRPPSNASSTLPVQSDRRSWYLHNFIWLAHPKIIQLN